MLGISACCMGCPVRYNGRGFDLLKNLGREKGDFTYCPVCPESLAGLGVMRDPIHLTGDLWRQQPEKNRLMPVRTRLFQQTPLQMKPQTFHSIMRLTKRLNASDPGFLYSVSLGPWASTRPSLI